jgi:drug/metabolite transporter (DMT)-like permease
MSHAPLHLLMPLVAAILFAAGSLCYKRAFAAESGVLRTLFVNNLVVSLGFQPFFWFDPHPLDLSLVYLPMITGGLFFIGNIANVIAFRRGDVSLVTPLMGTKTLFVALAASVGFHEAQPPGLWLAAVLTMVAVLVLGWTDMRTGNRVSLAVVCTLISAASFGVCDAMTQAWAPRVGPGKFITLMSTTIALLTLGCIPWFRAPLRALTRPAWKWLLLGAVFTATQAVLVASSLAWFHDATRINVVYSTRGLWGIVLVWFVGHWFGSDERATAGHRMIWRAVGAMLLFIAVILAVRTPALP